MSYSVNETASHLKSPFLANNVVDEISCREERPRKRYTHLNTNPNVLSLDSNRFEKNHGIMALCGAVSFGNPLSGQAPKTAARYRDERRCKRARLSNNWVPINGGKEPRLESASSLFDSDSGIANLGTSICFQNKAPT